MPPAYSACTLHWESWYSINERSDVKAEPTVHTYPVYKYIIKVMLYRHRSGLFPKIWDHSDLTPTLPVTVTKLRSRTPSSNLFRPQVLPWQYCRSVFCCSGFRLVLFFITVFMKWLLLIGEVSLVLLILLIVREQFAGCHFVIEFENKVNRRSLQHWMIWK